MINLCEPVTTNEELKNIKSCFDKNMISTYGNFVSIFEKKISKFIGSKYSVACINGTSALHLALRVIGVNEGDEVLVPSLTFVAPVNAVLYCKASPIFFDCDDYFNIKENDIIDFINNETIFKKNKTINKRTKKVVRAFIPVHNYGNGICMDKVFKLCKKRKIKIIEDASESLGTYYKKGIFKGKYTGSIGDIGCLSFNGNKIITTGQGGMILTNNKKYAKLAKHLSTQAKKDKLNYYHDNIGHNYRMPNINASLGIAQFKSLKKNIFNKRRIYKLYSSNINKNKNYYISDTPKYSYNNNWLVILKTKNNLIQNKILKKLIKNNIFVRPAWSNIHLQKPYKKFQSYKIKNAKFLSQTAICLPSTVNLKLKDIKKISGIINSL